MFPAPSPHARWPAHVAAAVAVLRRATPGERDGARSALWSLLHASLFAALRAQAGRIAPVGADDLEDLASQKALELLLSAEEGKWDPDGRAEHEVAGYVSRVARHALVDLARRRGRECPAAEDPDGWSVVLSEGHAAQPRPEDELAAREFARALRECVARLAPRSQQAWFRRVFLERPSREIAAGLSLTPAHVDVVVQRARGALRECMERKGHPDAELRPGAFVEIWTFLAAPAANGMGERVHERDG
jgi:RNA polymerase sigma factor (sigma-70 family)